jgi:ketosteroid isomerase-like protein
MYKTIVRSQVRRAYAKLSRGEYEKVVDRFAPDAVFCMAGDHALGGENHGRDEILEWFRRAWRLFPDLRLEPHTITVSGGPWNTVIGTRFFVSASLPGGRQYRNEGMQFLRLRWGRAVEDRLYEDTQLLAEALDVLAEHGHDEAKAPPLAPVPADPGGAARSHAEVP